MRAQDDPRRGDTDCPDSVVGRQRRQCSARQTEVLEQQPPECEFQDRLDVVNALVVDRRAQILAQLVVDVAVHGFLITKAACTRQKQPGPRRNP